MRARLPVVEVEDDGGEADGDRDQDHREQEVATQQRQREGGGGNHLERIMCDVKMSTQTSLEIFSIRGDHFTADKSLKLFISVTSEQKT